MKTISVVFRKLTQNEFKAITNTINSQGGGSQTYIDFPKGKISDENFNDFFDGTGEQIPHGYEWKFNIHSLSLGNKSQSATISARRESSNCLREQNNENRINVWKNENSNFPTDNYNESTSPIIIFILKTDTKEFWAGWFYRNECNDEWFMIKSLSRMLWEDCGYIKFENPLNFSITNYQWPFGKFDNSFVSKSEKFTDNNFRPFITAIKSKPFLLLAGISGTGKSRIVREMARACWEIGSDEYKEHVPSNFTMIQVKPNWHDSSELIGYVSRISGTPTFILGEFLKFIGKAWNNLNIPYFLCLDEMNLAPVEQYFAEYLSVVESRKKQDDGSVLTDPILKKSKEDWYRVLTDELADGNEEIRNMFLHKGITIPQNLIVVGTVNMDETTFSFSRKVLDRAMTIEMNEVNLEGGLIDEHESIDKIGQEQLISSNVEGKDVYTDNKEVCDNVIAYLKKINDVLEGTPFKIAYRTRNEFLLYVVNNLPYNKDKNGNDLSESFIIARALDEMTSMKILSRIEGDDNKIDKTLLPKLMNVIRDRLIGEIDEKDSISLVKLKEMDIRLQTGYTSFWS